MKLAQLLAASLAIGSLSMSIPAWSVETVSYNGGSASITGIGNQLPGGTYDQLSLSGLSGTLGNSGTIDLNTVDFTVGANTNSTSPYTVTGSISEKVTIAGVTDTLIIPYSETVNGIRYVSCGNFGCSTMYEDSITLGTTSASFGPNVELISLSPLTLDSYNGTVSRTLTAYVTNKTPVPAVAPEIDPASAASGISLLLGCLMVFIGRQRPRTLTAA